jgi:3-ketosteroid 9alpha-monooxygenase subunit B
MSEPKPAPAVSPATPVNLHPNRIDPETAPRPRIKELEVMVAEVIRETADTATLVLFTGNDRLDYQPGSQARRDFGIHPTVPAKAVA